VNPIKLRVCKRGALGLVELSLFVNVNLWVAVVVIQAVAPRALPGALLFSPIIPTLLVTRYVGLALVGLSFVILILAQVALGDSWRLGIDEENPGELVTSGIYAFSRNPIYSFFDLYFLGTFLLNGTLFFALSAVFTVLNLHYQILSEEQHLSRLYGADYCVYRARTARYWSGFRLLRLLRVTDGRISAGTGCSVAIDSQGENLDV
jgi:protein-S-isoprenylcysteine O-methyltransferase Ste14